MVQMQRAFRICVCRLVHRISLPNVGFSKQTMFTFSHITFYTVYSYDDYDSDASLDNFDIHNAPSYLFAIIQDIKSINSALRVHVVPWSPVCSIISPSLSGQFTPGRNMKPGWMKDGGTMNGGLLTVDHVNTCE